MILAPDPWFTFVNHPAYTLLDRAPPPAQLVVSGA